MHEGYDAHLRLEEKSLKHQFEELQERASKDALSGLLNRVTAEQYIRRRLKELNREDVCALLIVDLDDFKQVNDVLGHQAGDRAIRQCAQILSGLFRAKDIVGRLGGDEFVVFLSGQITEKLVRKKGKKICENLQLALGSNPTLQLTASVGIYLASGTNLSFEVMYQAADLALYKAKEMGKHRFCITNGASVAEGQKEDYLPVSTIPLNGLLEAMDSGVALLEMGSVPRIIYVSPSFCRMIGVESLEYPVPQPLSQLVHPDDLNLLEQALREGLEKEQPVDHAHRISADGSYWAWWHIRAVHIRYDNPHPVMLVTTTDISRYKESEHRLQEINQRLQAAFDQTAQGLWEVDVQRQMFILYRHAVKIPAAESEQTAFPEGLFASGWVHPNSVSRFREFAAELLSGKAQGYGNFIVRGQDTDCYGWAALSYRMVYDEMGQASRAVGIMENLPQDLLGQQMSSVLRRPLPEALAPDLMVCLQADLTADEMKKLWLEGKDWSPQVRKEACTRMLHQEAAKLFNEDERQMYADCFERQSLLQAFNQGKRWFSVAYRRVDGGGMIHWVNHVVNLAEDSASGHVYLFLYIIQQDKRRRYELLLGEEAPRSLSSGLYDRDSIWRLVQEGIRRQEEGFCAVALLRLGGLSRLYAGEGRDLEEKAGYMAAAFSAALGDSCLIGQYREDMLLVFFPEAEPQEELQRRLEDAFVFVRLVLAETMQMEFVRFIAGISREPVSQAQMGIMIERAEQMCGMWHNAAIDTVVFSQKENEQFWMGLQGEYAEDRITVHHAEMNRPLSDGEKDVAFHCLSAMLSARSLEASLHGVLGYIGSYYHADRVYLLMLEENQHIVTMPFEWISPQKHHSIQQAVSGISVERFPLLRRCLDERAPVFLTRTSPITLQGEPASAKPWYFTVFPLMDGERMKGFLCVENSQEHPADAALFSTLIPFILREKERFQKNSGQEKNWLKVLPNLHSYLEVIHTLNSDRYSSMGAVCVDIPNLPAINGSLGFEHGSRMLWYVSKSLIDIFGPGLIFRTWEAEFVALCPNMSQQVFEMHCRRLRTMLRRRFPKQLRIGCTWADGFFTGKNLVNEARTIMHGEHVEASVAEASLEHPAFHFAAATPGPMEQRFTVFYQPKINMNTGELAGVEALVRGLDEYGKTVAPGRFIERLEENGSIRDLDMYVLDQALRQVNQWREQSLGIIPVSVNFSRLTFFYPHLIASVLAILSRYPQLPHEALELEITESAGIVEPANLQNVLAQLRQLGVRISLDDFGSQYANLSMFTRLHFDVVKLDRSLISQMAGNQVNCMLVRDIVNICRVCGMECLAEGVETKVQADALKEAGCNLVQGYLYDRPLPASQLEEKYLRAAIDKEEKI